MYNCLLLEMNKILKVDSPDSGASTLKPISFPNVSLLNVSNTSISNQTISHHI